MIEIPDFRDDSEGCVEACGLLDGVDTARCMTVCYSNQDAWAEGKRRAADYGLTGNLADIYALAYMHGIRRIRLEKRNLYRAFDTIHNHKR